LVFKANTGTEIEAAFTAIVRDHADALFVAPDGFFLDRRVTGCGIFHAILDR
jgi:hypothetical protein